jgi:hypothetical protein
MDCRGAVVVTSVSVFFLSSLARNAKTQMLFYVFYVKSLTAVSELPLSYVKKDINCSDHIIILCLLVHTTGHLCFWKRPSTGTCSPAVVPVSYYFPRVWKVYLLNPILKATSDFLMKNLVKTMVQ